MLSLTGKLLRWDEVPDIFHEVGIVSGYRHPRSSLRQCLQSLFQPTNETMNVWTHLVPALFFAWWFTRLFTDEYSLLDSWRWPLAIVIVMSFAYVLGSAAAHLFNTMSSRARHACFFLDYACIAAYSFGCALGYAAYSFRGAMAGTAFHAAYPFVGLVVCAGCVTTSCATRFMKRSPTRAVLRTVPFASLYMFDMVPVWYRLFAEGESWLDEALWNHLCGNTFAFLGLISYASHFPEKAFPGLFDIYGHSHQFFHLFAVGATWMHLQGTIADMHWCERQDAATLSGSHHPFVFRHVGPLTLAGVQCALMTAIVLWFVRKLVREYKDTEDRGAGDTPSKPARVNGNKQNGTKQNGTKQNGTKQNGTKQNGTKQNGAVQNGIMHGKREKKSN